MQMSPALAALSTDVLILGQQLCQAVIVWPIKILSFSWQGGHAGAAAGFAGTGGSVCHRCSNARPDARAACIHGSCRSSSWRRRRWRDSGGRGLSRHHPEDQDAAKEAGPAGLGRPPVHVPAKGTSVYRVSALFIESNSAAVYVFRVIANRITCLSALHAARRLHLRYIKQHCPHNVALQWIQSCLIHDIHMLQGRDDMRMDERLMQVLRTANSTLAAAPEAAHRSLHAMPFAITPLGPRLGLLQWVEGTMPLFQVRISTATC